MKLKFNAERFLRLIAAVERRPTKSFRMAVWAKRTGCGTVCCAAGSYIEAHPRCGLVLKFDKQGMARVAATGGVKLQTAPLLAHHFGVEDWEMHWIFCEKYRGEPKRSVVKRYREFYTQKTGKPAPQLTEASR